MTAASVTCPYGHHNPEHQHFCGECGAALPVTCLQQSYGPAPQSQNPFRRYWQGLSKGYKIGFLAIAVGIVGIVLLINVLITASLKSANSQKYKACEAAMQTEGYKGDELKAAVQFCVNYP